MSVMEMESIVAGGGKVAIMKKILADARAKAKVIIDSTADDDAAVAMVIDAHLFSLYTILTDGMD